MTLTKKTVEPGTLKTGRIMVVSLGKGNTNRNAPRVIAIVGDDGEGYLLINSDSYAFIPAPGMHVEYIAVAGGVTGIYWRLTREVEAPPGMEEPRVTRVRFLDNRSIAPRL